MRFNNVIGRETKQALLKIQEIEKGATNAETAAARVDRKNRTYDTLKENLDENLFEIDDKLEQVDEQLAKIPQQINEAVEPKASRVEMLSKDSELNSRINNLVISSGSDSSAEVQDSRVAIDGQSYPLLSQRLLADFNRTARTTISTLEPFNSKDGDLWFKPKQSSLYEGVRMNGASSYIDMSEHISVINSKIAETNRVTLEVVVSVNTATTIGLIGGGHTLETSGRYKFALRSGENHIHGFTNVGTALYTPFPINKKLYLTLVYNGTRVILYENGIEKARQNGSGAIAPFTQFAFGRDNFSGGTRYLNGTIFDIRLWNKAKSESEIKQDLGTELTGAENNLIGYWDLNEKTGSVAFDKTLNGLHGTIHNGERVNVVD